MRDSVESLLPKLLAFRAERDWEKFHLPKELASAISIEAGELLELFLWNTRMPAGDVKMDAQKMSRVREEVADVLIYLLFLCNDLDIDPSQAVLDKLEKNRLKYPVEEFKGRYKNP